MKMRRWYQSSSRLSVKIIFPSIFALFLILDNVGHGERIIDGPYLGNATSIFSKPNRDVAAAVEDADVVFIGTTKRLDTSKHDDIHGRGVYTGDVVPERMLKRSFPEPTLTLTWHPSATGIATGSKHIFFIKRRQDLFDVLKEIFVHEPQTYPCCRTYGAMDGGTSITLGAISFFVSPQDGPPKEFSDLLLNEVNEDAVHRQATAVLLACEIGRKECLPALAFAITHLKEHWSTAVYTACSIDGEQGAKAAMSLLEPPSRLRSDAKLEVFEAVAMAQNPTSFLPLKELGDEHPEYRVSCAFAIRQVANDKAPATIESWLADHKQDGLKETISTEWNNNVYRAEYLLEAALRAKKFSDSPVR